MSLKPPMPPCKHEGRCPTCHKLEWFLKRKEALEQLVYMLEANANCMFSSPAPEWNLLLRMRDKLQEHIRKHYNESKEPK